MVPAETCSYEPIKEIKASGPKVMVDGGREGLEKRGRLSQYLGVGGEMEERGLKKSLTPTIRDGWRVEKKPE